MRKTLAIVALAGVVALSTSALWAGTQTQAKKRLRDGSGTNCRAADSIPTECINCQGYGRGGNGTGGGTGDRQRKRDGSCLP